MWYRLASSHPLAVPMSEIMKNVMFHGTGEDINGSLKPGPYDGLLWTADNPAVAQNYIPSSGGRIGWHWDQYRDDDDEIEYGNQYPNSFIEQVFKKIGHGYPIDAELHPYGTYKSWRYHNNKKPTYGELHNYIRSLGYDESDGWLNVDYRIDEPVLPKNHKSPGRLFIGTARAPLNIFDTTEHMEHDQLNPAYNELGLFKSIEKSGYDGVKINDFAQSRKWGNVNHTSTGLFPHAIEKVDWRDIPAVNFDWDDELVQQFTTPEWDGFHAKQVLQALSEGYNVDPSLSEWANSIDRRNASQMPQ